MGSIWRMYVVKTDASGNIEWSRTLGGSGADKAYAIRQSADGGYVVVGETSSNNGDVIGNNGGYDLWVVKLDADGILQWQRPLGGPDSEGGRDAILTPEGNIVIAAYTAGAEGDVSEHFGGIDFWIVNLDADGGIVWERSFGGDGPDLASAIICTSDGGFMVVGGTQSTDGHITDPLGDWDMWALKLDAGGELEWQRTYGGSGGEGASSVVQTDDGGYLIAGSTNSTDGDITTVLGNNDVWLVRINADGELIWQMSYGGSGSEGAADVVDVTDGFAVIGSTTSTDGDVIGFQGGFYDIWALRVDLDGNLLWQRALGGPGDDRGAALATTIDGGYILVSMSSSSSGDVTSAFPGYDIWVAKLAADPTSIPEIGTLQSITLFANPVVNDVALDIFLSEASRLTVELYATSGQLITTVSDRTFHAGTHMLRWSVEDLTPGIYALRIVANGQVASRRFVKI